MGGVCPFLVLSAKHQLSNIIGDIKVNKKPRNLALTYNAKIGLESGYYMIINKKSGRALDAGGAGEKGKKVKDLAIEYGIAESTVRYWVVDKPKKKNKNNESSGSLKARNPMCFFYTPNPFFSLLWSHICPLPVSME